MPKTYTTIEVRMMRGVVNVIGLGRTPRGQRYIKLAIPTTAPELTSTDFKGIQAAAVTELFREAPPDTQ